MSTFSVWGKLTCLSLVSCQQKALTFLKKMRSAPYLSRELRNRNPKFGRFNRPNLFYPIYVRAGAVDDDGNYLVSLEEYPNSITIEPFNSEGVESCWRWGKDKFIFKKWPQ